MASMRLPQLEYPSESVHPHAMMTDGLPYPSASQYAQAYYPGASMQQQLHPPAAAIPRPEQPVRKRPKYTRSKTGCLTCRAKKVKCDEAKPDCTRCQQGQRECKWPEGVPTRKKPAVKKESLASDSPVYDGTRPSTACSSVSDLSTPPTRNHTPPKQEPLDIGLPPMVTRRQSDNLINMPVALKVDDPSRLQMAPGRPNGYPVQTNTHTHIISGPGMLDTSSQYPTHGSYHDNALSTHHYPPGSVALPRLPAHHSSSSSRFEPTQHWNSPQILQTVDPIQPYFPSTEERNLIRHYCDNALGLIMALPSENPVLAANMQLLLGRAPGSDAATEALRHAMLGVAATHQAYLYTRSGASLLAEQSLQLASGYRSESQRLLDQSCRSSDGVQSDACLAASVALSLADIFSGGYNWAANMSTSKSLVNMRGGPAVLLARSAARSKPGTMSGVSRARLFVEIISVYDIFGSLVTGNEPTLLSPHTHCWWLESANSDDTQSHVEKCFGMSRTFIPLLVKVIALLSRSLPDEARADDLAEAQCMEYAKALYDELEEWNSPSGLPDRIEAGNRIYKNTAQIVLLRDVLRIPPEHNLVQQHADIVLALCLDCGQQRLSVDLNWPVIIAGAQAFGADRTRVLEIFECFREQCCYEIETSEHIVQEVWTRTDNNHPYASWRSVVREQGLNVLIL